MKISFNNKITQDDFCALVAGQDTPILFWDTCSLLNIFNILTANLYYKMDFYRQILKWIKKGKLISVSSEMVMCELTQNIQDVLVARDKNEAFFKNALEGYATTQSKAYEIMLKTLISRMSLSKEQNKCLVEILAHTYFITEDDLYKNQAHFRVRNQIPPSKNQSQYKDCYIWYTFLCIAKALGKPFMAFMTDNTTDFCTKGNTKAFDQEIQDDLVNTGGKLFVRLGDLYGALLKLGLK